jgi:hypothetical protein
MLYRVRTLLFALAVLLLSASAFAQVGVMITFAPPQLPVYEQPICPGDGYIWTPGYWAYGDDFDDYYWVPGTWVLAPEVGFLWTPGYWGWGGTSFVFYEGYWGPQIGFYGGVNYGFGYFGEGYEGGRWDNGHFFYNRSVNNVNVTEIHNVYNTTVVNNNETHISYNGGNGGISARPTSQQEAVARERHVPPVVAQTQHAQAARNNPQQRASVNMGKPAVAATSRPGTFQGGGVVAARAAGAPYTPPANRGRNPGQPGNVAGNNARENQSRSENGAANGGRSSPATHVRDLPPAQRPAAPNTGNPKMDQKYQQQQEKQFAKQDQERQKLAQRQQKEDQKIAQQNADAARKQQVEQRHQQQTQQLQQRHEQQQQHMQQRMQPPPSRPEPKRPPK